MRDDILDDPKVYDALFENMPKSLMDRLTSSDPEVYELHLLNKKFFSRGGDRTTNLKCVYRTMWMFWKRFPDWRNGYRYMLTVSDRKGDLDWENIIPLIEDGYMAHDLREDDRRRLDAAPMTELFDAPPEPEVAPLLHGQQLTPWDIRVARHKKGTAMFGDALRPYDARLENNGVEGMFHEARRNPALRKLQDYLLVYNWTCIHVDVKTAMRGWECSIEPSMLLEAARLRGILFFVFGIESESPFQGALFATDVLDEVLEVELRPKPSWSATEYADKKKELQTQFPRAVIRELKCSDKLSNDPLIKVVRSAVMPINQFITEVLKIKQRVA